MPLRMRHNCLIKCLTKHIHEHPVGVLRRTGVYPLLGGAHSGHKVECMLHVLKPPMGDANAELLELARERVALRAQIVLAGGDDGRRREAAQILLGRDKRRDVRVADVARRGQVRVQDEPVEPRRAHDLCIVVAGDLGSVRRRGVERGVEEPESDDVRVVSERAVRAEEREGRSEVRAGTPAAEGDAGRIYGEVWRLWMHVQPAAARIVSGEKARRVVYAPCDPVEHGV